MPGRRVQHYQGAAIAVSFDPNLCIHAARCLQSLPEAFDVGRRKWIEPDAASPDDVALTVRRCPSGALQYRRTDGGADEVPEREDTARPQRNGPINVRGDLVIRDAEGGVLARGTRFSLCRCGESQNKPFCDNTHRAVRFLAD